VVAGRPGVRAGAHHGAGNREGDKPTRWDRPSWDGGGGVALRVFRGGGGRRPRGSGTSRLWS